MKKHKFHFIIALSLISALLFNTCKKYPEGGLVYYRIKHLFGKNADQASKSWKLKLYEVNGIDSTNLFQGANSYIDDQQNFVIFLLYNCKGQTYGAHTNLYDYAMSVDKDAKTLGFGTLLSAYNNDTSQCFLKNNNLTCQRNILNPEKNKSTEWNIRDLTATELTISKQLNNNYKIILSSSK